jgi:hypothetical protein
MKYLMTVFALSLALLTALTFTANARAASSCEARAADKKLSGDARKSFLKKCHASAKPASNSASKACSKSAAEKKLVGAAKNSYIKKCVADGSSKSFWK